MFAKAVPAQVGDAHYQRASCKVLLPPEYHQGLRQVGQVRCSSLAATGDLALAIVNFAAGRPSLDLPWSWVLESILLACPGFRSAQRRVLCAHQQPCLLAFWGTCQSRNWMTSSKSARLTSESAGGSTPAQQLTRWHTT